MITGLIIGFASGVVASALCYRHTLKVMRQLDELDHPIQR